MLGNVYAPSVPEKVQPASGTLQAIRRLAARQLEIQSRTYDAEEVLLLDEDANSVMAAPVHLQHAVKRVFTILLDLDEVSSGDELANTNSTSLHHYDEELWYAGPRTFEIGDPTLICKHVPS